MRVILLLTILFANSAHAQACAKCKERKKQICSTECSLVTPVQSLKCQKDCANQYCSHRCSGNSKHEALLSCDECLDQQFELCKFNHQESNREKCKQGSNRVISECKLECAKARCEANCN